MKLNSNRIHEIYIDCLLTDHGGEDDPTKIIIIDGLQNTTGFIPEKLDEHLDEISNMLNELHGEFKEEVGGGYSFLFMSFDKNDNQWGEQFNARELMEIAIAMGKMEYLMPRELWCTLPGCVPYVVIPKERKTRTPMSYKEYLESKKKKEE